MASNAGAGFAINTHPYAHGLQQFELILWFHYLGRTAPPRTKVTLMSLKPLTLCAFSMRLAFSVRSFLLRPFLDAAALLKPLDSLFTMARHYIEKMITDMSDQAVIVVLIIIIFFLVFYIQIKNNWL